MRQVWRKGLLVSLAAAVPAVMAWGETVSATVGMIRISTQTGPTVAIGSPFVDSTGAFESRLVAAQLALSSAPGDKLSLWVGAHFNPYSLSDGAWRIHGTDTEIPEERLTDGTPGGFLLTRQTNDGEPAVISGELSGADVVSVAIPPGTWRMFSPPYAAELTAGSLADAGATEEDRLKLWDADSQSWDEFVLASGTWTGPEGAAPSLAPGTVFLFHNASGLDKTLTFGHPSR
ncbi:MAG: hypothetical protein HN742_24870 [Lentisphaerae bacterium]|jgi:hypothetical protein|nr:hypothetical protein [Lentisphaerota bacterium]MBT4822640.1 hypothetical protein [Lentisphaerota bacterium]MBT5608744.1 hypothetical protein [Lentisphaerota bacterium]MBT7054095.1 hypothetical protein [Lentisphaerota bacterium]MBT7845134.1 hypothetical protein [Lentisphaerota bacterium]